jgi:ATP-dependent Lhr-like helicase
VRERLERADRPHSVGRWALIHRLGVLGQPLSPEERAARQARQLLARYGVVTRECLEGEAGAWDWERILAHVGRMELRGEVRRGYFVRGLPGVQFALPEAVERLRALRDEPPGEAPLVLMNACDPANLYGPAREGAAEAPGEPLTFARLPSTWLVLHRGLPILVAADSGAALTLAPGSEEGLATHALRALLEHLARFEHRITVETWNREPVLDSPGRALLEAVGLRRAYPGMVWERPV